MSEVKFRYDGHRVGSNDPGFVLDLDQFDPSKMVIEYGPERYYLEKVTSAEEEQSIPFRIARHAKTCEELDYPNFAPSNGICWHCKRQIFNKRDGCEPITGCPYCGHSFVD